MHQRRAGSRAGGNLGQGRIAELAQRLLPALQGRRARHVILDLTGCGELLTDEARSLGQLARAIELLGARPVLTGIHPSLARTLIASGTDLAGLPTLATLREAIESCSRGPEQQPAGTRKQR